MSRRRRPPLLRYGARRRRRSICVLRRGDRRHHRHATYLSLTSVGLADMIFCNALECMSRPSVYRPGPARCSAACHRTCCCPETALGRGSKLGRSIYSQRASDVSVLGSSNDGSHVALFSLGELRGGGVTAGGGRRVVGRQRDSATARPGCRLQAVPTRRRGALARSQLRPLMAHDTSGLPAAGLLLARSLPPPGLLNEPGGVPRPLCTRSSCLLRAH